VRAGDWVLRAEGSGGGYGEGGVGGEAGGVAEVGEGWRFD